MSDTDNRRGKEAQYWRQEMFFNTMLDKPPHTLNNARVTLKRHSFKRLSDKDLEQSFSYILDGLKQNNVVDPTNCDILYQWETAPLRLGKISVEIEEKN